MLEESPGPVVPGAGVASAGPTLVEVDEFLVDRRLVELLAAWRLVLARAPDFCQLRFETYSALNGPTFAHPRSAPAQALARERPPRAPETRRYTGPSWPQAPARRPRARVRARSNHEIWQWYRIALAVAVVIAFLAPGCDYLPIVALLPLLAFELVSRKPPCHGLQTSCRSRYGGAYPCWPSVFRRCPVGRRAPIA